MLGALTAPASPAMLTATGWTDVDATSRYWRHELRYGPAVFDGFEVHAIENGRGRRHVTPCELPACRWPLLYGRLEWVSLLVS
jgi:hypothetical protein